MDPIKVDFSGKGGNSRKTIVIPPEKSVLKIILSVVLSLVVGAVAYYFMLPPMNFKALEFYYFLGIIIASFVAFLGLFSKAFTHSEYIPYLKKKATVPVVLILVLALVIGIGYVVGSQFFRAKSYSQLITVQTDRAFSEDIDEPNFETIPKLDQSASASVASRALSDLANLGYVSQFTVYPSYPQINYQQKPVRVATLQYANIIKWFTNKSDGFPGYIIIDTANEDQKFVECEESIKYSLADHFGRNIKRVIRFEYPTYMFDVPSFEIDENGDPYWICAKIDKTIGLFGGRDVVGIVIVDAVTGECSDYSIEDVKENPELKWIDRVYSDDLIIEQYDFYGRYRNGFWNSVLGQEDCVETTEGSNYIALDDDVWLYTGVTSLTSDQSIAGFMLVNQRTKETRFYSVNGAKEETAREAAEGLVQDLEYKATFPILVNVGGEPTYFMSLKNKSDIVEMYALINVRQYNKVKTTGKTISECLDNYLASLKAEGVTVEDVGDIVVPDETGKKPAQNSGENVEITGTITEIRSAVISGNTVYYFRIDSSDVYYSISANDCETAVILSVGDTVKASAYAADGEITGLESIEKTAPEVPVAE
ncbi:MAG: CvpA family protein [Clostridia bacterium]|nr:CvpA family protein [Clostridia bacterium]